MKQSLFTNLNNFTKKFKLNQEIYTKKYKELGGGDDESSMFDLVNDSSDKEESKNFLQAQENKNNELLKRDEKLNDLLNRVNDLSQVFKDMQTIVSEQGTILDRIDYNIDITANNVQRGKKGIDKANQNQEKSCYRNVMMVLIICIFIEGFLIIFKFL